ncbi:MULTISPECIES: transposase [unclassified Streptomyces]|uniref:IS701 family transposase n=1 Tax=unclassified Streptomyces TaxID=2593676 RepID=UPI00278C8E93|nr:MULTISPECIES: transposase [unclassified Streptomyces]
MSLPRSDQRRTAEQLLRGMMTTPGRKTARNMALRLGDPSAEQRFQHFIAKARWDWEPVRRALAAALERHSPAVAHVAHPLFLHKAGKGSVGVHERFVPELGHRVNGQFAYGLWHASRSLSVPVGWHLELPDEWLTDPTRRVQAAIPERIAAGRGGDALPPTPLADLTAGRSGAGLPVIADARRLRLPALVEDLARAGLPWLVRTSGALTVLPAADSRCGEGPLPVHQLLWRNHQLRRPLDPRNPRRTAVAVRVHLPRTEGPWRGPGPDGEAKPLTLLAEWDESAGRLRGHWLTNIPGSTAALMSLTACLDRAPERADEVDASGLRDYSGRSFMGWHRHMTMVSVAHALRVLSGRPTWSAPPSGSARPRAAAGALQRGGHHARAGEYRHGGHARPASLLDAERVALLRWRSVKSS